MENTPVSACQRCKAGIANTYYTNQAEVICQQCYQVLSQGPRLGGFVAFLRACLFGGIVAVLCAVLSFAISYLTGYELGIVWLFLGVAIGIGVHVGSEARGGIGYQLLAVLLTYLAIGSSLTILAVVEMRKGKTEGNSGAPAIVSQLPGFSQAISPGSPTPSPLVSPSPVASASPAASSTPREDGPALTPAEEHAATALGTALGLVLVGAFLALMVVAMPVVVMASSPISIVIYGFGMHSAWKVCRRQPVELAGPFELRS